MADDLLGTVINPGALVVPSGRPGVRGDQGEQGDEGPKNTAHIGDMPPSPAEEGDIWWDTVSGQMFIYYVDPTSAQWVLCNIPEPGPPGPPGVEGPQGDKGEVGETGGAVEVDVDPPVTSVDGVLWFDSASAQLFIRYDDQWVVANSSPPPDRIDGTFSADGLAITGDVDITGDVNIAGGNISLAANQWLVSHADLAPQGASTGSWSLVTRSHRAISIDGYVAAANNQVDIYRCNPAWAEMSHQAFHVGGAWAGIRWNVGSDFFDFRNGARAIKSAGTGWEVESDARAKDIHGDYLHGLQEIMKLKPVTFAYRRERTAPSFPNDKTEYVGLTTQNVEDAGLGEFVTKEKAEIEGRTVTDLGYLEPDGLVFTLINAVKELSAQVEKLTERVRDLEAK